jgi:hypothetical protein
MEWQFLAETYKGVISRESAKRRNFLPRRRKYIPLSIVEVLLMLVEQTPRCCIPPPSTPIIGGEKVAI